MYYTSVCICILTQIYHFQDCCTFELRISILLFAVDAIQYDCMLESLHDLPLYVCFAIDQIISMYECCNAITLMKTIVYFYMQKTDN